jgi:hypothetical protein
VITSACACVLRSHVSCVLRCSTRAEESCSLPMKYPVHEGVNAVSTLSKPVRDFEYYKCAASWRGVCVCVDGRLTAHAQSAVTEHFLFHIHTVHRSRVDPRKECESCGDARFRERK